MKRHPAIGEEILSQLEFLGPTARQLVVHHQEHFDGSGYPGSLSGEQIPLAARLFSVVDAWDAMTSDRPYRAALDHDRAAAELKRCAGSQFDPSIVREFLTLQRSRGAESPATQDRSRRKSGGNKWTR